MCKRKSRSGVIIGKLFPCTFPECDFTSASKYNLQTHIDTHNKVKKFPCIIPMCGKSFSRSSHLKRHIYTHTNTRLHACNHPGCGFTSIQMEGLEIHQRTHDDLKPLICGIGGCTYSSSDPGNMHKHKLIHGEPLFSCDFPGCEFKCVRQDALKRHNTTHTIEGQTRRKKQENRVSTILKEWGYTADLEVTINASRTSCVSDTNRFYSRLDFTIVNCVNAILILEVDEEAHLWYNLSCELSRMADVQCALTKVYGTLPIYWLRYNPNGKYSVGSEQVKIDRPERENQLKIKLQELCSPDFRPENQLSIHYMFYSLINKTEGPEIMKEPEFPEYMKQFVSWNK